MAEFHKLNLIVITKFSALAVPVVALGLVAGMAAFNPWPASADACPPSNDIMTNGFSSNEGFINEVENGDSSGHSDLGAIYAHFGLSSSDYSKFESSAVKAVAQKNGNIVVDGQVVGTNGMSYGRTQSCQGAGTPESLTLGGTTIWGNKHSSTFVSDNLDMRVMFDDSGTAKFAVLTTCGNPSKFTPVKPVYSCDLLEKHPVAGKENTYTFTTKATATNNATIVKAVYDFGDGSPEVTMPDISTPTPEHTFTKSSTVKVTVFVKVPGKDKIPVTSAACEQPIEVKEKPVPPTPPKPQPKPQPKPTPTVLPKTGADGMVAMFGAVGASAGGYLGYRQWLVRRSKPASRVTRTRR